MKKKNSIQKNYFYNLSYQLLLLLSPLIITPYLTRVLGAGQLGIYGFTFSIVTIFFYFSNLGINTYGQREIAYLQDDVNKRSILFKELMILKTISCFLTLLIFFVFVFIYNQYNLLFYIFSIYIFSNLFDITWLYQGMEDFKNIAIRNLIIKILFIASIFIFIKSTNDLWIYILIFSVLTFITNISFWLNINEYIFFKNRKKLNIKRHIKSLFIFFIPQIATMIYTVLDKTMIGVIIPDISEVSYYEQASYIVKTILVLITTLGTIMTSRMSYTFEKKDYKMLKMYTNTVINFVLLSASALMFGIAAVIDNIVPWFYGDKFMAVIDLTYYLCPLILIIGLSNVIGIQYMIPVKKEKAFTSAVLIGAVSNFVLNMFFIKLLGTKGACISSLCAELIVLIILLVESKEMFNIKDILLPSIKYLSYGLIMFIIVKYVSNGLNADIISSLILIFIGAIVYIGLLLLTKDKFFINNIKFFINKQDGVNND